METQLELSRQVVGPPYTNPDTGIATGAPGPVSDDLLLRANQVSRRDDKAEDYQVGLHDIDSAIFYYFREIILPAALRNGLNVEVPVIFGNPEKWKAVQHDGNYRDRDGRRQVPLIMFRRDSVEKNRNITSKLDANRPNNFYITSQTYTARNQYDRFGVLTNRIPEKAYTVTGVPDFVNLSYSCIILTDYVEQTNKLIEAINFASDSYWGPEDRFKFQSFVDSFRTEVPNTNTEDRTVQTQFGITLRGYILPTTANANPFTSLKRYRKTRSVVTVSETTI